MRYQRERERARKRDSARGRRGLSEDSERNGRWKKNLLIVRVWEHMSLKNKQAQAFTYGSMFVCWNHRHLLALPIVLLFYIFCFNNCRLIAKFVMKQNKIFCHKSARCATLLRAPHAHTHTNIHFTHFTQHFFPTLCTFVLPQLL